MFAAVINELGSRLLAAELLTKTIAELEESRSDAAVLLKGLAFVQMYSIYEFTVRGSVQATLSSLRASAAPAAKIRHEALSLVLDSSLSSAAQAGPARLWECRIDLLGRARSPDSATEFPDSLFPADGSHYRIRQLHTIWRVFGIGAPVVPDARLQGRIEEMVENRNAVAHGRRTADDVGRRYSLADIKDRMRDLGQICEHVLATLETHYNGGGLVA